MAELANGGGECTLFVNGTLSGSKDGKGGGSASWTTEQTGVGLFDRIGDWDINAQPEGETTGSTITMLLKIKCSGATSTSADGCVLGPASGYAKATADADLAGTLNNLQEK